MGSRPRGSGADRRCALATASHLPKWEESAGTGREGGAQGHQRGYDLCISAKGLNKEGRHGKSSKKTPSAPDDLEPERQPAVQGEEPAERGRGRFQDFGTVFAGVHMIEVVVCEVVVEGRGQFEVEAPDAVIEGHTGVQGQREGVFLLHPGIFPIRP